MHHLAISFFAAVFAFSVAEAQPLSFPEKPVRMIVPFPAGGTADALPRIIAERLRQRWNQAVIVENRAGAGGNIGASAVAVSEPDGYTLLASPPGPFAINGALYKQLSYDPAAFEPVVILAEVPNVLAVRKDFPAGTFAELVEYARTNPGKINYASQGRGTTSHLTAEMFQAMANIKMTHVSYRGTAPALVDLAAGVVDLMFDNVASTLSLHGSQRIRIYAVAGSKRVEQLPGIATLHELGLANFQSVTWFAIGAPRATPAPVIARLNEAINEVLQERSVRSQFETLGATPIGGSVAQMASFVSAERNRWAQVIAQAQISVEE